MLHDTHLITLPADDIAAVITFILICIGLVGALLLLEHVERVTNNKRKRRK